MSAGLSKTRFQKGLQCEKALWLSVHEPESADPITEATQWRFDRGSEVGRLAHTLFPNGVEVTEDFRHSAEAVSKTAHLLGSGARVLYEPAFIHDGLLVRVDLLVGVDGSELFDLYEVKSSTRLKPEHITDAAVQTYVVEGSGLRIRRSHVVHLDSRYVYQGGTYDASRLFAVEDVTTGVRAFLPLVPDNVERFKRLLEGPEPCIAVGQQCRSPYPCDFRGRCHAFLPTDHPVTDIPRVSDQALRDLFAHGIYSIGEIPDVYTALTPAQRSVVRVVKRGEPEVDSDGVRTDLARLEFPVRHLDFETFRSALPLWPGTRPYELIPFQYSIHIEDADGSVDHVEYLHSGTGDPRRALTERLLQDLGDEGSIVHYTGYERQVLAALAASSPDVAERIARLQERLFDLEAVVRNRTRHPATNGRTSIKCVLPAWCDDVTYSELQIQDGETASVRYLKAITGELDDGDCSAVMADLAAYCSTDTLAMVRLLDTLRNLGG